MKRNPVDCRGHRGNRKAQEKRSVTGHCSRETFEKAASRRSEGESKRRPEKNHRRGARLSKNDKKQ